jgi:hypothetical protein
MLREWSGHYVLYDGLTARIGRLGTASLIIFCVFAESKVRRYLLFGAMSLFFYFAVSLGDIAI